MARSSDRAPTNRRHCDHRWQSERSCPLRLAIAKSGTPHRSDPHRKNPDRAESMCHARHGVSFSAVFPAIPATAYPPEAEMTVGPTPRAAALSSPHRSLQTDSVHVHKCCETNPKTPTEWPEHSAPGLHCSRFASVTCWFLPTARHANQTDRHDQNRVPIPEKHSTAPPHRHHE